MQTNALKNAANRYHQFNHRLKKAIAQNAPAYRIQHLREQTEAALHTYKTLRSAKIWSDE